MKGIDTQSFAQADPPQPAAADRSRQTAQQMRLKGGRSAEVANERRRSLGPLSTGVDNLSLLHKRARE